MSSETKSIDASRSEKTIEKKDNAVYPYKVALEEYARRYETDRKSEEVGLDLMSKFVEERLNILFKESPNTFERVYQEAQETVKIEKDLSKKETAQKLIKMMNYNGFFADNIPDAKTDTSLDGTLENKSQEPKKAF